MELEVWKPIEWTDGWYEVSNLGRVRSWRVRFRNNRATEPRIMATSISKRGYRVVRIRLGRNALHCVHRLVCEAFHGPAPLGKNDCRHLDGDELNNLAENLAWGSRRENMADAIRHGTHNHGASHSQAKLTDADIMEMRQLFRSGEMNKKQIAQRWGVTDGHVCNIINGKAWRHLAATV